MSRLIVCCCQNNNVVLFVCSRLWCTCVLPYSGGHEGDNEEMKALQQEMRGLRELLEKQQQQHKPTFDLSTLQHPFWQQQQGPFPFSSHMQNSNPIPPNQTGSGEQATAQNNAVGLDNGEQHIPSERKHPVDRSHPLASKVSMDTSAQQDHVQYPEHVLANGRKGGTSNKASNSKTTNRITPHKKKRNHHGDVQCSSTSQTNQSDSSISSLTSSSSPSNKSPVPRNRLPLPRNKSPLSRNRSPLPRNKSTVPVSKSPVLSELSSPRLSPLRAISPLGASPVTMETVRVPDNANLSTWVCPLCGGQSIIIDNSGTRQHRHQHPDEIKTRLKATQYDASSNRHGNMSTRYRRASSDPVPGYYTPNLRSSGLHRDSDTSSARSDHGYDPNSKSRGLHYNTGNRSRSVHCDSNIPSFRSTSLNRNIVPSVRNSGLDYSHSTPHAKSRTLHYDDNIPGIRSSGLHHGKQYKPYRRSRRKERHKPRASVTFSQPKATSTPAYLCSTTTHDCSSDSSDVGSSLGGGAQRVLLESAVSLPRYVTHHHVGSPDQRHRRHYYGSRYVLTSSDDEIDYQPVTR